MPDAVHQNWQISVYQIARTPYKALGAEIEHQHWGISHVQTGRVETLARGECAPAPAGAVMVHSPSLPSAEYAAVPGVHEWVVFDGSLSPGLDLFRLHPLAPVVPLRGPPAFSQALDQLLAAWEDAPSPFRDLRVSSHAGLIVFLSQNLHRRLTRDDLAAFTHLRSSSVDRAFCGFEEAAYFSRVFRQATGRTPGQYRRGPVGVVHNSGFMR